MSQPATRERGGRERPKRTRYEDDLYTWAEEQVALLQAGQLDQIDSANIAEELQDVGNEQFFRLESAFRVLLMHMLKWDQQPERKSRSWEASIEEQRDRIEALLRKNPGLKSRLEEAVAGGFRGARRWAAVETGLPSSAFAEECPYTLDAMMHRPFETDTER